MLPRCISTLKTVPAEWRTRLMRCFLLWLYVVSTISTTIWRAIDGLVHGRLTDADLIVACSVIVLWLLVALMLKASESCFFDGLEISWWLVFSFIVQAAALTLDDVAIIESRLTLKACLTMIVPALLGMRFWQYSVLVSCLAALSIAIRMYSAQKSVFAAPFTWAVVGLGLNIMQNAFFRQLYATQSQLSVKNAALESLTHLTCDATFWLADEQGTVASCDDRVEDVFRVDMQGKALVDVVSSTEDARRLTGALTKALETDTPATLLPITVNRHGTRMRLELLIVGRNVLMHDVAADKQRLFVGIRRGQKVDQTFEPALVKNDCFPNEAVDDYDARAQCSDDNGFGARIEDDVHETADGHGSAWSNTERSLPQTTGTGRVFNAAYSQDVGEYLTGIKKLLEKERWFIPPAVLQLRSDTCLGKGGYGAVVGGSFYGAPVAVKLPLLNASVKGIKELNNELRILRHARHPNLVQCFGASIDSKLRRCALVLELVPGESLRKFQFDMPTNSNDYGQRFQVIAGVTNALSYLHSRYPQIVHGDLKPDNVLLQKHEASLRPKLLDFGLSCLLTSHAKPLGGTLRWMAPEVAQPGRTKPMASADIFSLGYLIYYVITGYEPYAKLTRDEIQKRRHSGVYAELTWSSQSPFEVMCKEVAERCLQPVEQRTSISVVFKLLFDWVQRNEEGDKKARWRSFEDIEFPRHATPGDNGPAIGRLEGRSGNIDVEAGKAPTLRL
eukprot:TRINITY_DN4388_c0_g2_i2.p1 TRINITY_DN4388_c0_g2~~TRINITY_DN4388_c0_g2_i2.p1  ORF type:complete len:743 (-),score=53.66 TRINITY_DN4388_c0_g2_i2:125-2317(-)